MSLFPDYLPEALTVTELTRSIRALLEGRFGRIWVQGEISNYRKQGSGHQYFTLKDDRCQLPCVLFSSRGTPPEPAVEGPPLADGQCVQAYGEVTVYEARGQYQLIVEIVQPRGLGALQARFEALKRKLQAEGLFEQARKQVLPRFPLRVGLVTSPTGAALQDMLNVLRRRAPWVPLLIYPVRVQGQGAALEIADAIAELNTWAIADRLGVEMDNAHARRKVDLIVLARGGGSMEDLFEFNEEVVARAIAASALPVVSAVGHEIDFTIADFTADVRAPTPSAAAELIVPDTAALLRQVAGTRQTLGRKLGERIRQARTHIQGLARTALGREPSRRVLDARQQLDGIDATMLRLATGTLTRWRSRVEEQKSSLRPSALRLAWQTRRDYLHLRGEQLTQTRRRAFNGIEERLQKGAGFLRVLGPQGTLDRGYSITSTAEGALVLSVSQLTAGTILSTRLADGTFGSTVTTAKDAAAVPDSEEG